MKQEAHFPTILGLVLLIASIIGTVYLTSQRTTLSPKASGDCQPANIKVTNLTSATFDLSFTTSSLCLATLKVNDNTYQNKFSGSSLIHYFQISNLTENTEYKYSIIAGGQTFADTGYQIKTPGSISSSSSSIAWGRVYNKDGKTPTTSGIIYLNIPEAEELSSLINSQGYWNISLANISVPSNIEESITVLSSDGSSTQVKNQTSSHSPVGDIIIGQNTINPISKTTVLENNLLLTVTPYSSNEPFDIFNPKDNDTIFSQKPEFFGKAPSDSQIKIKVESPVVIDDLINSSSDGQWQWTPSSDLSVGDHTITVTAIDPTTQKETTIIRHFTVLASENNPEFTASGSATIIITPTIGAATTDTIVTPTQMPNTTITSSPTPPVTGNLFPTSLLFVIPLLAISLSLYLLK